MAPYKPPQSTRPTSRFPQKYTPKATAVTCKSAPTSILGMTALTGKAKVEAELEARNIERTAMPEDDRNEEWERETTPNRTNLTIIEDSGASGNGSFMNLA